MFQSARTAWNKKRLKRLKLTRRQQLPASISFKTNSSVFHSGLICHPFLLPRVEPAYQELLSSEIPKAEKDGVSVAVIAGEALGVSSPVFTRTPSMYLDFTLQPGASVQQHVPEGWNGFAYTLSGTAVFDAVESGPHHTLQLGPGDSIKVENKGKEPARFVLIAGKPLNEPVVQHGPFVMNTREEIMQAFNDYQYGRNGFERAHAWSSA